MQNYVIGTVLVLQKFLFFFIGYVENQNQLKPSLFTVIVGFFVKDPYNDFSSVVHR